MKRVSLGVLFLCLIWLIQGDVTARAEVESGLLFDSKEEHQEVQVLSRVGWNFRISGTAATAEDEQAAVAYNATANQYLVVWRDERKDATRGYDIFGQRFLANGTPQGGNFRISGSAATSADFTPAVAYNSSSNQYLVVWEDRRNQATRGADIYGQRISANGARLGNNFRISGAAATSGEIRPAVAYNSTANQYMVVWSDYRNYSGRGVDIYGQRVSATGTRVGSNVRVSGAAATRHDQDPSIAYNSSSKQFLVAWSDYRNLYTTGFDIYAQRLSATGARLGSNFRISGMAAVSHEHSSSIAHNSTNNQYLVVWSDDRNNATRGTDIYGQRVSASGARLGNNFRVSGVAATENDSWPSVVYNSQSNRYFVVWSDYRNTATRNYDIYGQQLWSGGARMGGNFRISGVAATARDTEPAVAHNSTNNKYLVVWSDDRNNATRGTDIYGQRWSP